LNFRDFHERPANVNKCAARVIQVIIKPRRQANGSPSDLRFYRWQGTNLYIVHTENKESAVASSSFFLLPFLFFPPFFPIFFFVLLSHSEREREGGRSSERACVSACVLFFFFLVVVLKTRRSPLAGTTSLGCVSWKRRARKRDREQERGWPEGWRERVQGPNALEKRSQHGGAPPYLDNVSSGC
jgi:hypothetical protein